MSKNFIYPCLVVIGLLLIGCKKEPYSASQATTPDNLESKMAGEDSDKSSVILLSNEYRKLGSQISYLTKDTSLVRQANASGLVDSVATALSSRLFMEADPNRIVKELTSCYFGSMDIVVENNKSTIKNLFPYAIFELKKGNLIGCTMLMLLLGEKADIPLYAAQINKHLFIRYHNGKVQLNIELTRSGEVMPDSWYKTKFAGTDKNHKIKVLTTQEMLGIFQTEIGCVANRLNLKEVALQNYAVALNYDQNLEEPKGQLEYMIDHESNYDKILGSLLKVRSDINLPTLDNYIGMIYLRKGEYKSAAEYYEKAILLNPDDISTLKNAAIAFVNLHDFNKAKQYLGKVIAVNPQDSQAIGLLEKCPR